MITQGWRQVSQEVRKSERSHEVLTHGIVLGPSVLKGLDVFLLESQNIILVLSCLIVIETLTDDSDEHIHENEEGNELEQKPEKDGNDASSIVALVHDSVP